MKNELNSTEGCCQSVSSQSWQPQQGGWVGDASVVFRRKLELIGDKGTT